MIEAKKMIKSGQEQAVASWINYLNQVRLDRLMEALQKEELNLNEAMSTIGETLKTISRDIVNNGKGRGGQYGMHGFIAEVAECGIGNAREQIEGKAPIYEWINDNGPEDLRRGATLIQQKFVNGGGHLSLQAIRMHLNAYPDFLDNGGVYQIPEEHYEKIKWLLSISEKEANKMSTSTGDFSLKQWREVHEFFKNGDIPLDKVEPSKLKYSEVQKGTYEQTFSKEKDSLRKRNQERKEQALKKEESVDDVLVVYCAKHPAHKFTTVVGWYKHATVFRHYQEAVFAPEDIQYYNAIANSSDCVLLPAGIRSRKVQWEVPRKSNGWAYGFGRANVWYASEEDSRLQDYLARLEKQINEYDGENWIEKYAE